MNLYARVDSDGNVLQWPIYDVHIENRGLPYRFFEKVNQKKPDESNPLSHSASQRKPKRNENGNLEQSWKITAKDLEVVKKEMKDKLSSIRWKKEVGGIDDDLFGFIGTSREQQSQITSSFNALNSNMVDKIDWKMNDKWKSLSKSDMFSLSLKVVKHVESSFLAEKYLSEKIDSASSLKELEDINMFEEFNLEYKKSFSSTDEG